MDKSLEILYGISTDTITKKYWVLADLIKEFHGKIMVLNQADLQITLYK